MNCDQACIRLNKADTVVGQVAATAANAADALQEKSLRVWWGSYRDGARIVQTPRHQFGYFLLIPSLPR